MRPKSPRYPWYSTRFDCRTFGEISLSALSSLQATTSRGIRLLLPAIVSLKDDLFTAQSSIISLLYLEVLGIDIKAFQAPYFITGIQGQGTKRKLGYSLILD